MSNPRWFSSASDNEQSGRAPAIENPAVEPFERRYLVALSKQGVDLAVFLAEWRRVMDEDLQRLNAPGFEKNHAELPRLLHRLSGAVSLVGAQSLADALRRASSPSQRHSIEFINTLAERIRSLVTQLESASEPYRST